jgi:hypothetical protein
MKKILRYIMMLVLFLSITGSYAQQKERGFGISFYGSDSGVKLRCASGCAWQDLSVDGENFWLNEVGMIDAKDKKAIAKSAYLIYVAKKGNTISLTGKKGTNWKTLSFTVPNDVEVKVDRNGMK